MINKESDDMKIWDKFNRATAKLLKTANGKNIIIWGYSYSGWFLEHLIKYYHGDVSYRVDGNDISRKIDVRFPLLFETIDPDVYVVFLTFNYDQKAESYLAANGFLKGVNVFYLKDFYFQSGYQGVVSYYTWLEQEYGLELMPKEEQSRIPNHNEYGIGAEWSTRDILSKFSISSEDSIFDFGCGKGGALIHFHSAGFGKIGGVEYEGELYNGLMKNFDILGYNTSNLIHGDASDVKTELDEFNYFYFNNPFTGDIFKKVIQNIEDSYDRKNRKIILIYAGPFCHKEVIANHRFKLSRMISTDHWYRDAFIYVLE